MNNRKGYGTKIYDYHLKAGQRFKDTLDWVRETYHLIQSQAIRYAVLHVDYSGCNSDGNEDGDAAPVDDDATASAVQLYSQEELLTLQSIVKVLNGLKKEFHKAGSNLNQIAHNMNLARQQGDLHFTQDDVDSVSRQREEIREKYEDISSLISYLETVCKKQ
ncbi:MAG: hypothetical protein LKE41_11260 [Prevotella sp.]|jgi:hypothetical protein|nr:hypothetical protein [Prevotella sp.]